MSRVSDGLRGDQLLSRRTALAGTALALGAVAAGTLAPQAAADQKIGKTVAQYQATPKGDQHCARCVNFQPPKACKFVEGDISPNGWCQLFSAKG
jgi:hypothetical protein